MPAIRDPNVPVYEDQGQTSDDGWPDSNLYDNYYGRFIPPYTRTPQTRNETLNDVNNQIQAENAAVEQRRQLRRLLEWRHERPDPVTWRGTEPGYNDDTINVYPDSQGIPFNTGVDEREQAFNRYMGTGEYPWPVQPGGPIGDPNAKWYPNDDLQGIRGLQTPVPEPGPHYIPPIVPTPPTPSEIAGRGPDQKYVSGEMPTKPEWRKDTPAYNYERRDKPNVLGGVDTFSAGFAPPFSAVRDKNYPDKPQFSSFTPKWDANTKDDSNKVNSVWKLLFGGGPKKEIESQKPQKPTGRGIPTPKTPNVTKAPVRNAAPSMDNLLFGQNKPDLIFGRRPQAPKPKPKVEPKVSKPITRSAPSSSSSSRKPPKSDYGLTPSNRSYPSSSSRNVAPRRTAPPPPPIYRPPTNIVDVVDETPYSPPPVYKPPVQRRFGGF